MILQKVNDKTNILSSYLSQSGDLVSLKANYVKDGETKYLDFPITYTQIGDKRYTVLTLSPVLEVNQSKKYSSPFIFIQRQDNDWLKLNVAYTDENGNIATTESNLWTANFGVEMGYISLQDGSVWLSNAIFLNFFDEDKNTLKTTGEKHSNSYKTNIYLDLNQLKQIK